MADTCPPCKLLLNGDGMTGMWVGIKGVKDHLNSRGMDFSPSVYKKLCDIICGAHKELAAYEPELVLTANHVKLV